MSVIEAEVQPAVEATTRLGFDYTQIDEGIRDEVQQAARSIQQLERGVVTGMIAIGKRLIEVKGMIEHGQFTAWVEGEFGLAERTAQNWMNMARTYNDSEKAKKFSVFSPSVMYLLAAPSTPEAAREEVEQAAADGKRIDVQFAKEAIRKAKPEPVQYAPVRELESKVKEWLARAEEQGYATETVLAAAHDPRGTWGQRLESWLAERDITYRLGDLKQAINNVREQRRQAKRQAEARVVYVEPKPITIEEAEAQADAYYSSILGPMPTIDQDPDEAAAIAAVEAEAAQEEAARVAVGDEAPPRPEPKSKPKKGKAESESIIHPHWVTQTLTGVRLDHADFQSALKMATAEQVRECMAYLSTMDKHHAERLAAYRARLVELQPPPAEPEPTTAQTQASVRLLLGPESATYLPIPQRLLAGLHSDLLAHYAGRVLSTGDRHTLAGIVWKALEAAEVAAEDKAAQ